MRKTQVFALLNHANEDLNKIESEYNNALKNKTIPDSLKIDIKNFLENLRSSLDYMAHDIYEQKIEPYRKVNNKQDIGNIYFPYGENVNAFKSRIGACLPELNNIDKNLYSLIESIQSHLTNDNWLCDFCNITNEKKT